MRVHLLSTPEAQARGVIGLPGVLPDEVFFFPDVDAEGTFFHMIGVPFPIEIAFLDGAFRILRVAPLAAQHGRAWPPRGTRHAAETAPGSVAHWGLGPGSVWDELRRAVEPPA